MLKWLSSLTTAISGRIGKSDRLDAATRIAIAEEDVRDSGDLIEPRGPASNVNRLDELERLLKESPLEELERLLREPSRGL